MNEREIRNYLNRSEVTDGQQPLMKAARQRHAKSQEASFQNFSASHLFCNHCHQAMPVKEKILLYLPDGDLYEFKCTRCGSSVGTKKVGKD